MRRGDDRLLARSLADALDGRARPTGELEALVRVLEAAAAEARFDVPQAETERALATARPGPVRRRRLLLPAAVAVGVAVALAAGLLLLSPSGSPTLVNVQARALAALGGRGSVLEVTERIVPGPAGGFTPSTRTGWIDAARGEARWTQRTRMARSSTRRSWSAAASPAMTRSPGRRSSPARAPPWRRAARPRLTRSWCTGRRSSELRRRPQRRRRLPAGRPTGSRCRCRSCATASGSHRS